MKTINNVNFHKNPLVINALTTVRFPKTDLKKISSFKRQYFLS